MLDSADWAKDIIEMALHKNVVTPESSVLALELPQTTVLHQAIDMFR